MQIKTKHFGEVEIDESRLITFKEGIYGFEEHKKFVLLCDNDEKAAFSWLQCLDDADLALPLISPILWFPNYSPEIADELIESIGELKEEDLSIYSVVVVPENIENMTTNLKAPILINVKTKKGIQVIVEDDFAVKQNLYDQVKLMEEAGE